MKDKPKSGGRGSGGRGSGGRGRGQDAYVHGDRNVGNNCMGSGSLDMILLPGQWRGSIILPRPIQIQAGRRVVEIV